MPEYRCTIAVKNGKSVKRVIHAESLKSVRETIEKDGGFLIKVSKTRESGFLTRWGQKTKIGTKQLYAFSQEFLTLLRAGLPVVIAFDTIIEKLPDESFGRILTQIRNDISKGESVTGAFEKFEYLFTSLYISLLKSGEASGDIPGAIEEYLQYFERATLIRRKIRSASVYPAILSVCSIFVVAFLIVFVVPTITGTFVEAGAQLPVFTQLLLMVSHGVKTYFGFLVFLAILFAGGFYSFVRTDRGRMILDTAYLRIPVIGPMTVIYATAMFSASLSTILKAGVPLNHALPIARNVIQNRFMRVGIKNAIELVERGQGFASALYDVSIFPDMALRMISAGEEAGNLEKVLKDVAQFYEKELDAKLSVLTSAIEPALMVLMGIIIGFIMLAMYMPIFQMAGAMS